MTQEVREKLRFVAGVASAAATASLPRETNDCCLSLMASMTQASVLRATLRLTTMDGCLMCQRGDFVKSVEKLNFVFAFESD